MSLLQVEYCCQELSINNGEMMEENINTILKKAQTGDSEAIDWILKEYSKILSFNAQKYYLIGAEQEDLLQEGILGLLKAIKFYDETKSSFSSFAFLCIRREMISAIRKANTQKNSILNEALTTSSMIEDSSDIDNYISSENNPEEAYLLKEEIKEFKNFSDKNFSKLEKEVLKYLIRGYSYREIAKILSKNLKSIDNTIQRIRKKSEDWINKEEI